MRIKLASNSPRRRELLAGLDLDFEVQVMKGIDESYPDGLGMREIAEHISLKKAEAYTLAEDELLITADTIVWLDGEVLGKPRDEADAVCMLRKLSGKTHQVITGVTLRWNVSEGMHSSTFSCVTDVTFAELSDEQINYYVRKYRPMDKAGAYGIQGQGAILVREIRGDYNNVVGLPVSEVFRRLDAIVHKQSYC
jgi:septum formation protein